MKHVHPTRQRQVRGPQRQPVAAACALLFLAAAAHAQQAPAAPESAASEAQRKADATIDTVVVTGIRQSLDTSLNLKRQQRGVHPPRSADPRHARPTADPTPRAVGVP